MYSVIPTLLLAVVPIQDAPAARPVNPSRPASADAIKFELLQYTDRVERDGTLVRTQDVRVQLNSSQWVSAFGQLGNYYLEGYGDIQFGDIVIDKPDGRHISVTNAIVEDVNPYGITTTSLSADLRYKKVTIPGLEPGDRLAYHIVTREKPLAPGHAFGDIKLTPTADSATQSYELDLPRDAHIRIRLRESLSWEDVPSAPDRVVRRFVLKPIFPGPGVKQTKEDIRSEGEPDVIFTSFDSWNEVTRWWWGISKDRLLPDAAVTSEAQSLTASMKGPAERIAALHAFASVKVRYLNVSFGLGRMQPRKAPEVLANRYGDCKDKHALLAALASSVGIEVRPVLINSSRKELRDDVPSPQQFDHVISVARLGSKPEDWLWLDSTNPFAGSGYLLPNLRDKPALLIEANGDATMVRTPKAPPFATRQEMTLKGVLGPDGLFKGHITLLVRSDMEVALRSMIASLPQDRRAEVAQRFTKVWRKIDGVSTSEPLDLGSPFRIEFDAEDMITAVGNERQVTVPSIGFDLPDAQDESATGSPAVQFRVQDFTERAEIELPEGQQAQLPLSVSLERSFGLYRSSYRIEGRTVKTERTLRLPTPELAVSDTASYEAFRSAITKDRHQKFIVTGVVPETPAVTAVELWKEGTAALRRKEYEKAVELLRKATELDPKANGFVDLGDALYKLHKYEEAVTAFSRQIEQSPFDEFAYAWRALALEALNRTGEAERDLLKQIEVAPFHVWSYQELGRMYSKQGRHRESAEVYEKAATIEPKVADNWLTLAEEQRLANRQNDARQSLQKATSFELEDWRKIRAGRIYRALGDAEAAGRLAAEALPSVTDRLAKLNVTELDGGDAYWTAQLAEAWHYVGNAAAVAGDYQKAEKYLQAAWRLDFLPEAGWTLGELRAKQGRLADAVEFWSMAEGAGGPLSPTLPIDRQQRIAAASAKLPGVTSAGAARSKDAWTQRVEDFKRQSEARSRMTAMRTVRLQGPVVADITEQVVLVADDQGHVERVVNVSRKSPKDFEKQMGSLAPIRVPVLPQPDEHNYRAARTAVFTCFTGSGCALVFDVPEGTAPPVVAMGSIRITNIDPKEGATLQRGERVKVMAKVHFEIHQPNASVQLIVIKEPRDKSQNLEVTPLAESGKEAMTTNEGDLTLTATFVAPTEPGRYEILISPTTQIAVRCDSWVEVR
jgi:tetratricopeptide (TPR) repeat protein